MVSHVLCKVEFESFCYLNIYHVCGFQYGLRVGGWPLYLVVCEVYIV